MVEIKKSLKVDLRKRELNRYNQPLEHIGGPKPQALGEQRDFSLLRMSVLPNIGVIFARHKTHNPSKVNFWSLRSVVFME